MLRYLHTLSALSFYLLGSSFFVAYILLHNGIGDLWPETWMQVGDLPLLLAGVLFGGTSVVQSFHDDAPVSGLLIVGVMLPLLTIFIAAAVLTFAPSV